MFSGVVWASGGRGRASWELRPYQKDGFNWLVNNSRNGFGSLLADDMGWGKTIQVLAFLLPSKKYHVINGPALVVVPTTLISNWLAEVKKWAPSLRVHVAVGRLRKFLACATPERVAAAAAAAALPVRRRLAGKQQNPENAVQTLSVSSTPAAKRAASTAAAFKTPMKVHGTDKRKRSTKLKPKQADVQFEEKDADIFLTSYWTFLQDADKLIASQNIRCHHARRVPVHQELPIPDREEGQGSRRNGRRCQDRN